MNYIPSKLTAFFLLLSLCAAPDVEGQVVASLNPGANTGAAKKSNFAKFQPVTQPNNRVPLCFTENAGQVRDQYSNARKDIQYTIATSSGLNIFIGNGAIHYQFGKQENEQAPSYATGMNDISEPITLLMYRMDVTLIGANKNAKVVTDGTQDHFERYYTDWSGQDGVTAHSFDRITYKDIYPKIDWVLYINNGQMKHEFVVRPGGKISDIKLKYAGAEELKLNNDGSLTATTPMGTIIEQAPRSYAGNGDVPSSFVLNHNILSYQACSFSGTLVIDPGVLWATYYGGANLDDGMSLTTDASGNVYMVGTTYNATGIATTGAHQTTLSGTSDAFIVKFNSAGARIWSTYYGGTDYDIFFSASVDSIGNLYVGGRTNSASGIATTGAHQVTKVGTSEPDAFLVKFNSSGTRQWGTYYGGGSYDSGDGLAVDAGGTIYFTGYTRSSGSISTPGAYQTIFSGGANLDAFLVKFSSAGVRQWGTYYGGSNGDQGFEVAIDGTGDVYMAGITLSTSGIASPGAHQVVFGGGYSDLMLVKFNSAGMRLWATYYGGGDIEDRNGGLSIDGSGNIYLGGCTQSSSGIASPGAYQTTYGGFVSSWGDGFVAKFSSSGNRQWCTYYGGSGDEAVIGIYVDTSANVFVVGSTNSTSGIATPGAYQPTFAGGVFDVYVAEFDSAGSLQWCTYYGGSGTDFVRSVVVDSTGNIYVTGETTSTAGIATTGAYQAVHGGTSSNSDAFLVKFGNCPPPVTGAISGAPSVCAGTTIALTDTTMGGVWTSSNVSIATIGSTGIVTGIGGGIDTIFYSVTNSCGTASVSKIITVNPFPGPIAGVLNVCEGSTTTLSTGSTGGLWSSSSTSTASVGSGTGIVTGIATGISTITYVSGSGCTATTIVTVQPLPGPITGALSVCEGSTTALTTGLTGGVWSSLATTICSVGSATGIVTGISGGVSTITYSSGPGCTVTAIVTVNPLPAPISGPATVCIGTPIALTTTTTGMTWSSSAPSVAVIGSSSGIVSGVTAGVVTFWCPALIVGVSCSRSITVTVNPTPVPIAGASSVCVGATTGLTDMSPGGTWTSSTTSVATIGTGGLVTGVSTGTAMITYTLPGGCYTTKIMTVNSSPGSIGGTLSICIGGSSTLTNPTTGGTWTSVTPTVATIGSTSGVLNGVNAGLSTISYSIGSGCVATAVVTVNALPGLFSVAGGGSYCVGGAGLHVGLSGSAVGVTYQLYVGASMSGTPLAGTGSLLDFGLQTAAGTYTVVATNANGCTRTMTGSATIAINPSPSPISGPTAVCIANTITQTNTGGGTWLSSTPSIATIGSTTGIVTGVATGTTIITYTLPTGCSVTKIVTVSTSPSAIVGASTVCTGANTTLTNAVGGGGWSSSSTSIASVDAGTGVVSGVATGVVTISYSLGSGCTVTRAMTVMPSPAVPAGTMNICVGSSTTLTDATTGGAWSSSLPTVGSVSVAGVVTGVGVGTTVISYTVGSGCASGVVVTVNPVPAPITGAAAVCVGSSATVTDVTIGGAWSTTSTTVTIGSTGILTGVSAGTATITYAVGTCTVTRAITVNALPTISGGSGMCVGATIALTGATGGGTWSATGTVTVGTTGIVMGVSPGVGTVTYTLPTGCYATKSITVNTGPAPILGTASVCVASTTTLTDAIGGGIWSSSSANASIGSTGVVTGIMAGTATITYSLGSGCITTRVVTVNPLPSPITGIATVCIGATTTLSDAVPGGIWTSGATTTATVGATSGIVTGVTAGTAVITYTTGAGCSITRAVTVMALPLPITGPAILCVGTTTALSSGTPGGTWTSSNVVIATIGSSTGIALGVNTGTATISYTAPEGCRTTRMVTVNLSPPAITGPTTVCAGLTITLSDATPGGTWSSSNTARATVTPGTGVVTGVSGGSVVISYTAATGCSALYTVIVNEVPPMTGLHNMCAWGDTLNVSDANPAGTYSSALVTVVNLGGGNGIVTANAPGTATVTYTLSSGCAITRTITVNPLPGSITGSTSVCVGGSAVLTMTTVGGTWSSSALSVATIGSTTGIVNGLTTGVSTIRYMLPTGCKVDTVVHVYPLPAPITVMSSTVLVGVSIPFGDPTPGGTWSSAATAIATVGAGTGMVHGVAPGVANIRYTLPTGCGVGRNVTVIGAPGTGK